VADFRKEAAKFATREVDRTPLPHWLFNAYFVTEEEFMSLHLRFLTSALMIARMPRA